MRCEQTFNTSKAMPGHGKALKTAGNAVAARTNNATQTEFRRRNNKGRNYTKRTTWRIQISERIIKWLEPPKFCFKVWIHFFVIGRPSRLGRTPAPQLAETSPGRALMLGPTGGTKEQRDGDAACSALRVLPQCASDLTVRAAVRAVRASQRRMCGRLVRFYNETLIQIDELGRIGGNVKTFFNSRGVVGAFRSCGNVLALDSDAAPHGTLWYYGVLWGTMGRVLGTMALWALSGGRTVWPSWCRAT